ncbi:hypothetical protein LWI28_001511 [Acer negundo]|uniref:Uncharacterized protein n=1 Tax=Acer negundo TaxID=4023 RepID=A0AAD5NL07_ACENE|nr:hypothetical protein LWI28_001511 [Acer negundo]
MIVARLFPLLTADRKRWTSSVTRPGATPPSDESGNEGSKDDAPKYIPKDLAGDAPEHTTKGDLGHSEV